MRSIKVMILPCQSSENTSHATELLSRGHRRIATAPAANLQTIEIYVNPENNSIPQGKRCCQPTYQEIRANGKHKDRENLQATKDDSLIKSI